jgi:hypothetical protein
LNPFWGRSYNQTNAIPYSGMHLNVLIDPMTDTDQQIDAYFD